METTTRRRRRYKKVSILSFVFLLIVNLCSCDINQDKAECANQLVGLATCLPFVGGDAKAPTPDCCTGLKQVIKDSKRCLCILVKDRNDPSLGLKVNATIALTLPKACQLSSKDSLTECPALLHLPPNSPDAKVFNDFAKAIASNSSTPVSTGKSTGGGGGGGGTSAKETSDTANNGKSWLVAQVFNVVLIWCFVSHLALNII